MTTTTSPTTMATINEEKYKEAENSVKRGAVTLRNNKWVEHYRATREKWLKEHPKEKPIGDDIMAIARQTYTSSAKVVRMKRAKNVLRNTVEKRFIDIELLIKESIRVSKGGDPDFAAALEFPLWRLKRAMMDVGMDITHAINKDPDQPMESFMTEKELREKKIDDEEEEDMEARGIRDLLRRW